MTRRNSAIAVPQDAEGLLDHIINNNPNSLSSKAPGFENQLSVEIAESHLASLLLAKRLKLLKGEIHLTNARLMLSRAYTRTGVADIVMPEDAHNKGLVLADAYETGANGLLSEKLGLPEPKLRDRFRQALRHVHLRHATHT